MVLRAQLAYVSTTPSPSYNNTCDVQRNADISFKDNADIQSLRQARAL